MADTLTVLVGSRNPIKIQAVRLALQQIYPEKQHAVSGLSVPSGVAEQPMSDQETRTGAVQRCAAVLDIQTPWLAVGIEGGIEDRSDDGMLAFAWVCAMTSKIRGEGRSASFYLPEAIASRVRAGMELGAADDAVFGRQNSKQSEGAIGLLSRSALDRATLYSHAVIAALLPVINPELYQREYDHEKTRK